MSKAQLLDRRAKLPSRMHRDDVINRNGPARTCRRLKIDRPAAKLAKVVRTSAKLRHQTRDMHPPKVTMSPTGSRRPRRHQRATPAAPT
jgi:hypothetical protein